MLYNLQQPRSLKKQLLRLLLLLLLVGVRGAGATKCPDGSEGLTKALYEAGNRAAYANVTCIPSGAFKEYEGAVNLPDGLKFLVSVEIEAFRYMTGKLTIAGNFPINPRWLVVAR